MRVRITKHSKSAALWYSEEVGNEFDVEDYDFFTYKVVGQLEWIHKGDCEILTEPNELEQIAKAFSANAEDFDAQMTRILALTRKQAKQIAELEAQIAAKPPTLPHWRETVSEDNPVLVNYGDKESSLLDGTMYNCTDYDPVKGYKAGEFRWKYAKRVPQSVVEKLLAGYSTTIGEE